MAKRRRRGGPNQSEYIRELFKQNPKIKIGDAKKAWTDAGHPGSIGNSLFYVIKRKEGLTTSRGKRRGRPPGSKNKAAAVGGVRRAASGYAEVEDALDRVIHLLWRLGDDAMVGELRMARRKLAAKLV